MVEQLIAAGAGLEVQRAVGSDSARPISFGTRALPLAALDIESRAGSDELLDHERVALHRGQDDCSEPAEKSAAGLSTVRPMQSAPQSAHGPYPSLLWTLRSAPASIRSATTGE